MPPLCLKARTCAAAVALALLAWSRPSAATAPPPAPDSAATAAATAATPPSETWIAVDDIADRADSLARQLEAADSDTTTDELLARLTKGVNEASAALETAFANAKATIRDRGSLMAIQDARQQVEGAGRDFPAWQEELAEEGRRLAALATRMDLSRQLWTRTRARGEVQAAGEVILHRIDRSLQDLEKVSAHIHDLRTRVLALDDRIVDHDTGIRDTLHNLEEATRTRGSNLTIPDREPLWHRGLRASLAAEWPMVPGALTEFRHSTAAYFALDRRPFVLQAVLILVLMILFHRMRDSLRHASFTEQMSEGTVRLLSHPYPMALLLGLLPSPLLHPSAPRRVTQLIGMVALIPVARILSLVNRSAQWPLYAGLLAMLLLDRVAMGLTGLPTIFLVIFLAEIVIGWTLAFAYRRRLLAGGGKTWLTRALTVGMYGLVLAMGAEIGGWSSLAALVGRMVLVAGMTGILISAAAQTMQAVFSWALASPLLRSSRFINHNQELVHRWAFFAVRIAGVAYWVQLVTSALGLKAIAGDGIDSLLATGITFGEVTISLGGTLAFFLTLAASMVFSRFVHEMLEDEIFPRMNLPRGIPHALVTLANYTVWSLGFLLALAAAGVQLSQLAILLGGLGVGIGLGLQDVVKNFAAGITLLFERRVHVGDAVEIPGKNVFGRVLSIGMRASVVRNWNGTEVVMPNDDLVAGSVTNWTLSDPTHRIEVPLQVAADADPEEVMKLLLSVASADPTLLKKPAPSAAFLSFGPGTLDFRLRAWTAEDYEKTGAHTSRLTLAVYRALKEAGIRMPDTTQEIALVPTPPAVPAGGPKP